MDSLPLTLHSRFAEFLDNYVKTWPQGLEIQLDKVNGFKRKSEGIYTQKCSLAKALLQTFNMMGWSHLIHSYYG